MMCKQNVVWITCIIAICHQTWNICGDCVCVRALAVHNSACIVMYPSSLRGILYNQDVVVVHIAAVCDNLHCLKVSITCSDIISITHPYHLCWRRVRCTTCNGHESISALIINEIMVFTGVYSRGSCIHLRIYIQELSTPICNFKNTIIGVSIMILGIIQLPLFAAYLVECSI